MNLNLSIEQLEIIATLLWRAEHSLINANWILDEYKENPEDSNHTFVDHEALTSAATVMMERQLVIKKIMRTIESEVGLKIDFSTDLQRCELVNKSKEAE